MKVFDNIELKKFRKSPSPSGSLLYISVVGKQVKLCKLSENNESDFFNVEQRHMC